MGYLLDTNTISRVIRRLESARLSRMMQQFDQVAISVITEAEILFGVKRRPEAHHLARRVRQVLSRFAILPWTSESAAAYATLRAETQKRGIGIAAMDLLIAAHALGRELTLVTNDAALHQLIDFMPVEDWL